MELGVFFNVLSVYLIDHFSTSMQRDDKGALFTDSSPISIVGREGDE